MASLVVSIPIVGAIWLFALLQMENQAGVVFFAAQGSQPIAWWLEYWYILSTLAAVGAIVAIGVYVFRQSRRAGRHG